MSALLTEGFQPTNNNLAIYKRTRNARPTITYIETDIIIYNLLDTDNPPLRTTAFRYLKRKSATISNI